MKINLKKCFLYLLFVSISILQGCNTLSKGSDKPDFDFKLYYKQNISRLLSDLDLSKKDFTVTEANNYKSNKTLAFAGYEGYFNVICDSDNNVMSIDIAFPFYNLLDGYEIASDFHKKYDSAENSEYLSNEDYEYTLHEFMNYKSYEDFQNEADNSDNEYFISQAVWNLDSSVQVCLKIRIIPDNECSVNISMMSSDSVNSISNDNITQAQDDEPNIWQSIESPEGITICARKDSKALNLNFTQTGDFIDLLLPNKGKQKYRDPADEAGPVIASFSLSTQTHVTYFISLYDSYLVIDTQAFLLDQSEKALFQSFLDTCFNE